MSKFKLKKIISQVLMAAFVFFPFMLFPDNKIEKLEEKLKIAAGKEKINVLLDLAWEYKGKNPDKLIELANKALEMAKNLGDRKNEAEALRKIANGYFDKSDYSRSLEFCEKSLQIYEALGDKGGIASNLRDIGTIYHDKGAYPKALEYYQSALKLGRELGNKVGIAKSLTNIGIIYWEIKDYKKALEYYKESLKLGEELEDKVGIASGLINIGIIYHETKEYHKAIEYYHKSKKIAEKLGDKYRVSLSLFNMGAAYFELKQYEKALENFHGSLKNLKEISSEYGISNTSIRIGEILTTLKKYKDADKYLSQGIEFAEKIKADSLRMKGYEIYSDYYQATGEYRRALEYYKKHIQIKEQLAINETKTKLKKMEIDLINEKNQRKIESLEKEKLYLQLSNHRSNRFWRYGQYIQSSLRERLEKKDTGPETDEGTIYF